MYYEYCKAFQFSGELKERRILIEDRRGRRGPGKLHNLAPHMRRMLVKESFVWISS
jgi:hypothetical protein